MKTQSDIVWEIFWEIPECPPFLTSEPARVFTKGLDEFCGENFADCILEYRNNTNIWYLDGYQWAKLDKILFDKMMADVSWAERINSIAEMYCYPCLEILNSVRKKDCSQLTDQQLLEAYKKFFEIYTPAHGSGHPANLLEMKNQRLSKYLKEYVQAIIEKTHSLLSPAETFIALITPTKETSSQKEAKSLYRLLDEVYTDEKLVDFLQRNSFSDSFTTKLLGFPSFNEQLLQHESDWSWTVYNWEGPANSLKNYIESIQSLLHQGIRGAKKIKELGIENEELYKTQTSIMRELDVDEKHKKLLSIASDIMFLKTVRKDCMYKGAWASEPMYQEIANRLGLTLHETRFIFFFEMESALLDRNIDLSRIKERTKEVVLHQKSSGEDSIFEGKEAINFINSLNVKTLDQNVSEIKGQVAYPGKAIGIVKYINTPDMMDKMEQGNILLAYVTQPNLLPAMKKAAAFITDFGGITCHAAIVAREWKVPCVIGTGNATKVLKDGDLVEVDAMNGIVKVLKRANN